MAMEDRARRDAALTRAMGALFGLGSLCFVVGPLSSYADAVGARGDAWTFFGGSILFTLGGATQCLLAAPDRPDRPTGLAGWRTAWIQSVGTLLFNVMTLAAITVTSVNHTFDTVVWGPNAIGSACFLISGAIFYHSSPRRGLLPRNDHEGWWEASANLLGCVLFGVSAVTGYATGHAGTLVSANVSNWTTTLGAVCFLACAVAACGFGATLKAPRLRRLRTLAHEAVEEFEHEVREVRAYVGAVAEGVVEELRTTD
jgi:hypothetical protein